MVCILVLSEVKGCSSGKLSCFLKKEGLEISKFLTNPSGYAILL